jgi:hypothetical protein
MTMVTLISTPPKPWQSIMREEITRFRQGDVDPAIRTTLPGRTSKKPKKFDVLLCPSCDHPDRHLCLKGSHSCARFRAYLNKSILKDDLPRIPLAPSKNGPKPESQEGAVNEK